MRIVIWRSRRILLRIACVFALSGLALMVWSVFDPSPFVVVLAMSIGQGVGTLSLVLFLVAVLLDIRRSGSWHEVRDSLASPETKQE